MRFFWVGMLLLSLIPSQKIQAIAGFMLLGGSLAVAFYSPGRG
jgi:hypothetical protein